MPFGNTGKSRPLLANFSRDYLFMVVQKLADKLIEEISEAVAKTANEFVENLSATLLEKIKELEKVKLEHPFGWSIEVNFNNQKYDFDAAISQLKNLAEKDPKKARALFEAVLQALEDEAAEKPGQSPDVTIFSQHGMTDDSRDMADLATQLQMNNAHIVAPNLGWINTLVEFESLITTVEQSATETFDQYPDIPTRILATSLGGILWIEALNRHREWWPRIESLILLGVPVGGANLARMVD
ncbi:MAG: hypothetical protein F6K65_42105, partial [Moorea sp. SIO3C2]|nr:hypothetical protein [Moorena sp. SIO3C2]